ncbi:hypothetical protein F4808DRAFT_476440 [Astrocystis sublimbata]|nr:hypothetical protein F4808DRAFT_476440 [Astrocystis sublimbata]
MKSTTCLISTLVTLAGASPLQPRQLLDFAVLDAAPEPSVYQESIGEQPHTVTYDLPAATQAATAVPLPVAKRDIEVKRDDSCKALPKGSGPVPSPDTAQAFLSFPDLINTAGSAPVPVGYFQTFSNEQGSTSAYGYSGFSTLATYDTAECARRCDNVKSCSGFNLYYERDPSYVPGPGCEDPESNTVIKCVYWGDYISAGNANNKGQWRSKFQVVIAGSNGYMKTRIPSVSGYDGVSLGDASINAPLDCLGQDTYMGAKVFTTSYFDAGLCAAACASQNDYNTAHPPETGSPKICQFFVTYMSQKNGRSEGQYCALYTKSWDSSYATNDGQWRGKDHYTNNYAFAYTNKNYVDNTVCPAAAPA